jgi:class 3 adenylate cyclase
LRPPPPAASRPTVSCSAPNANSHRVRAEKILTSRSALESARKQVTVLFCDLAHSTALAERIGPEAMHTLLSVIKIADIT